MPPESKFHGPPDGNLVLVLAKEYGQSPEQVEQWDEYWFERAAVELHGRSIYERRREQEMKKQRG